MVDLLEGDLEVGKHRLDLVLLVGLEFCLNTWLDREWNTKGRVMTMYIRNLGGWYGFWV